jgi:ABC-type uncharacterized transport system substrate-binding protein
MRHLICRAAFATSMGLIAAAPAAAHPHVRLTAKAEIMFSADGAVSGIRHAWTFDQEFSAFAVQELKPKNPGEYSREDLAPIAEVNITSLKEYGYFTVPKLNGRKTGLAEPVDYWAEYKDSGLTLHFTLPLRRPAKVQTLDVDVYDPSYFVEFALAEREPVTLVGAPAGCTAVANGPNAESVTASKKLSESFFEEGAGSNYGASLASRISIRCP